MNRQRICPQMHILNLEENTHEYTPPSKTHSARDTPSLPPKSILAHAHQTQARSALRRKSSRTHRLRRPIQSSARHSLPAGEFPSMRGRCRSCSCSRNRRSCRRTSQRRRAKLSNRLRGTQCRLCRLARRGRSCHCRLQKQRLLHLWIENWRCNPGHLRCETGVAGILSRPRARRLLSEARRRGAERGLRRCCELVLACCLWLRSSSAAEQV